MWGRRRRDSDEELSNTNDSTLTEDEPKEETFNINEEAWYLSDDASDTSEETSDINEEVWNTSDEISVFTKKTSDITIEETWDINVITESDKKRRITVPKNCKIPVLIKKISDLVDVTEDDIVITYGQTHLSVDKEFQDKKLNDYSIEDNTTVTMVLRMHGGIWVIGALKEKKITLTDLPGFITVTTLESEPDMISLDDSTTSRRAKMPCGHVIGPESMTSYCQSLLSEGKYIFNCPYVDDTTGERCGREWPFFLVRHVACLLPDELEKVEKKISENVLKKGQGIQQCPGCSNWSFRKETDNNAVECPVCTRRKGKSYQFCWRCLKKWNNNGLTWNNKNCGNTDCTDIDRRIEILKTCKKKQIEFQINAPSMRGCPRCGVLIEHKSECKHMDCKCGYSFCFFCLKPKITKGWQCKAYSGDCEIAPCQTSLPSAREIDFTSFQDHFRSY